MTHLAFVTTNREKFTIAQAICKSLDVELAQKALEIDEIQGEDSEVIIRDKVNKAYEQSQEPIVVSDDSWSIPGLKGFPGPYMKSIDHWLTAEDFLNLTRSLKDRRIILIQLLAYQDATHQQVFWREHTATLLAEARGRYGKPLQKVISMPGDNGLSVAEAYDHGTVHTERDVAEGWRDLISWYKFEVAR